MSSFVARERIVILGDSYSADGKVFFRTEGQKGTLNRWENFRLQVEPGFGYVKSTPVTMVQRWELTESLTFAEVAKRFPGREALIKWWQLKYLLFPRDLQGVLQRSIFRAHHRALVAIRVSDEAMLPTPLAEVFLPPRHDPRTCSIHLKVPDTRTTFDAGLSFFSEVQAP